MKLFIEKEKLSDNPAGFLRKQGYGFIQARGDKQDSFVRRLSSTDFPRLHMYVNERGEKWEFHLHLDQKPVSYKGSKAHSGEYEGRIVEAEIERLAGEVGIENFTTHAPSASPSTGTQHIAHNKMTEKKAIPKKTTGSGNSAEEKLGHGNLSDVEVDSKKIPFWKKNIL